MMGQLSHDQEQLFYSSHLDEAVPHDDPLREIAAVLDLWWVRSGERHRLLHQTRTGQPHRLCSRCAGRETCNANDPRNRRCWFCR